MYISFSTRKAYKLYHQTFKRGVFLTLARLFKTKKPIRYIFSNELAYYVDVSKVDFDQLINLPHWELREITRFK